MKQLQVFIFTVAMVMVFAANSAHSADSEYDKQRFQLFNAIYNSASIQRSKTTVFIEKRLFKIDTKTGEAWMLIDVLRDGKDIKYWKKIDNRDD